MENPNYGKIINEKHFHRLQNLLHASQHVWGGQCDASELRIAPAVLDKVTWDDAVMQEEIFGPLLPILTYGHMRDVIKTINEKPHPLALYLFSESPKTIGAVTKHCQFGGGCVNDTVVHLSTSYLPLAAWGPAVWAVTTAGPASRPSPTPKYPEKGPWARSARSIPAIRSLEGDAAAEISALVKFSFEEGNSPCFAYMVYVES